MVADFMDAPIEGVYMPEPVQEPEALTELKRLASLPNIVPELDEEGDTNPQSIAQLVVDEYEIDENSRAEWKTRIEEGNKLAMLVADDKNYPFDGAANIKYPLLTTAALQFNARAYPAIVQGNRVVKCQTWGEDPNGQKAKRGDRVSEHMSYQLLAEQPEWEEDTDKMLVIVPITGCAFRKVYYDPALGRTVTRLVTAERLVVNYWARSLEDVPRITEEMQLYPYEIKERIRSGRFVDFDYAQAPSANEGEDAEETDNTDPDAPHLFLEQHRLLDLDGDGYPEPYIVTVHYGSQTVCRIVANWSEDSISLAEDGTIAAIRKQNYYVKYPFLPSPDGGFYGWGFGWLLKDITESINTTINQMLDAGHMANIRGGFVSASAGIREKSIRLENGEFKVLQSNMPLKDAILPMQFEGPSSVLFNLLGLLVEAGKDVAAIKDVLTGEGQGKNASPTTTMALIEQGLQVFTSIYKRIHRALKAELGIHAKLNRQFLDSDHYNAFFDGQETIDPQSDYDERNMDILPVSDPSTVSKMQKLAKADFVFQISQGNPHINPIEALTRVFEAADIEEPEKLIIPPQQPDPETEWMMKVAAALELDERSTQIMLNKAKAMKEIAAANSEEQTGSLQRAQLMFAAISKELDAQMQMEQMNGQGGVRGMEGQPGDSMGVQDASGTGAPGSGSMQGAALSDGGIPGAGMGQPASAGGL